MFSGIRRYDLLAGRVEIVAVQADSLPRFWALLLRRMQWPVPPKKADERIVAVISAPGAADVLRVLATETASIITLARMLHDADKAAVRALRAEYDWNNLEEELRKEPPTEKKKKDDNLFRDEEGF